MNGKAKYESSETMERKQEVENATKTIKVNRIEWYIPSDVNKTPNLPDSVFVSLSTLLDDDDIQTIQTDVILRNLIQFFGFVPQAFSYKSLENKMCGYRNWQLSDCRIPINERDRLAAQTKSKNASAGCYECKCRMLW